jgi:hypothetical protein
MYLHTSLIYLSLLRPNPKYLTGGKSRLWHRVAHAHGKCVVADSGVAFSPLVNLPTPSVAKSAYRRECDKSKFFYR